MVFCFPLLCNARAECSFLVFLYMAGIKVYVTGEKELIMELQLKWAGNPNILVAAKAFGLKATVQVCSMKELVYLKFSMPAHTLPRAVVCLFHAHT